MDLKDLKKTWDKLASNKELDEAQIREMLGKRTKNLIERIDRNIRIGFFVLFALILVFILNDFVLSPELVKNFEKELELPTWLQILSVFGDVIIIVTFLVFVARYYKVKKICDQTCDLKNTLIKIISTLNFYRTLYYISIFIILISFSINFIAGVYEGVLFKAHSEGIQINEIEFGDLATTVFITLFLLLLITVGVYVFFRWGFHKLYGNYISKLKLTLKELEEINE
ncbi:hypothetical protein [Maribellus maritimus]|uniref:hypothetical protein n=1 Tax=Maribellus maritimus TaxID=2870838 RepID=UPI001EEB0229|nr:hypothetical protein [Maribellus maritimus]MCG6188693.1 hypothetical protein [Maribellus maritimus]